LVALAVAEVTVVASPAILPISTLALCSLSVPSPIILIQSCSTSFHGVSSGIAHMAGLACPVVLSVAAFAYNVLLDIDFAISAVPIVVHQIRYVVN